MPTKKPLAERIIEYLQGKTPCAAAAEDIAADLKLKGATLKWFWQALEELIEKKRIAERGGKYALPDAGKAAGQIVGGRFARAAKGSGFVTPDGSAAKTNDIFIPAEAIGSAMHGDRVKARITVAAKQNKSAEGEIVKVLERANETIVGTFVQADGVSLLRPDNWKIGADILVVGAGEAGAAAGMKIVAAVTRWPDAQHSAEAKVIEVLGFPDEPGVETLALMRRFGLADKFPAEAQAAAKAIPQKVLPAELSGRLDRRDFSTVTIDGDDSKDFDDAVYAERRGDGFFLGVYIADVSHYVGAGSPLDKEAYKRGTSVYLADSVVPMLPFELSNGICSLNEGVDRLVMACEMELDAAGKITNHRLAPAVIRSHHRLTYSLVNKILVDNDLDLRQKYADVYKMLLALKKLRDKLKRRRQRRGAIDFVLPEVKVKLDRKGRPLAIERRLGSLAESIIEECMVAANETVARHMMERGEPCLYRVHEMPTGEKIEKLNDFLALFGLRVNVGSDGKIAPAAIADVLNRIAGRPEERVVSAVALRSMMQARYSPDCLGHFGLAATFYTHFTSPIRRYPDLIVHRRLKEQLMAKKGKTAAPQAKKIAAMLPEIALKTSQRERNAVEAERDSTNLKIAEYMEKFVGDTFPAVVSGVTAGNLFVELENGAEGRIGVAALKDDYYYFDEKRYALIGEHTRHSYRLGDSCEVVLIRVSTAERALFFAMKQNTSRAKQRKIKAERGKPAPKKAKAAKVSRPIREKANKKKK